MKGDLRCVEGRLMRHDPQSDDPELETDIGSCPDCSGGGCGDDGKPVDKVGRSDAWHRGMADERVLSSADEDSLRERFDLMHKPAGY